MGKTKPFLDKKKALTFRLVHKGDEVATTDTENVNNRVLLPLNQYTEDRQHDFLPEDILAMKKDNGGLADEKVPVENRFGEAAKYGVYFEDQLEYDYMQHLRSIGDQIEAVFVPSKMVENFLIEKDGLSNDVNTTSSSKIESLGYSVPADADEDLMETIHALDDRDADEGELQDDFVQLANDDDSVPNNVKSVEKLLGTHTSDDNCRRNEYEKSRRWNLQLEEILDDYGDENIGELSSEQTDTLTQNQYNNRLEELCKSFMSKHLDNSTQSPVNERGENFERPISDNKISIDEIRRSLADGSSLQTIREKYFSGLFESDESDIGEDALELSSGESSDDSNCETSAVKNSAKRNQPHVINSVAVAKKIELSQVTGMPKVLLPRQQQRALAASTDIDDILSDSGNEMSSNGLSKSCSSIRPVNETKDEKYIRKKSIKEERRNRRMEKKALKLAFKEEKKKQTIPITGKSYNPSGLPIV